MSELRKAATILLLRDGAEGLEVFMVERHHRIDFASSALVFPGGKVDEHDESSKLKKLTHSGAADDDLFAYRIASLREAFEETGILLAKRQGEDSFLSGTSAFSLWDYRKRIEEREILFGDFLESHRLEADISSVVRYAHWITPAMMPKRFDTQFFIAAAPEGQAGLHDGREMVDSIWIRPKDALADGEAGKRQVIFPTRMNLFMIAECENVAQALAEARARPIVTVEPKLDRSGEAPVLRIPKEAGYPVDYELVESIK